MISAGIDAGTRSLKVCVVDGDILLGYAYKNMEADFRGLIKETFKIALDMAGIKKRAIKKTAVTGYGNRLIKKADLFIKEPGCMARGAFILNPAIRSVIDVGGLFINVVNINEAGFFEDSQVNETCAAGSGKFLEMISAAAGISIESVSDYAGSSENPYKLTSSCAVFAESDIISSLNSGVAGQDILAGVIQSIANKAFTLFRSARAQGPVALTGGLVRVPLFVSMLQEMMDAEIVSLPVPPQLIAAYGAALLAQGNALPAR